MALKFVKKPRSPKPCPSETSNPAWIPRWMSWWQRLNETGKVFDGIQPGVIAQVVATTLAAEPQSAPPRQPPPIKQRKQRTLILPRPPLRKCRLPVVIRAAPPAPRWGR